MYTDGVPDALNADAEEFGMKRLTRAVLENRHPSAAEIVNALVDSIRAFVGGAEPFDDMTMVVVIENRVSGRSGGRIRWIVC